MEHLADIIYIITLILLIIFNIYIYHAIFSSKFGKYPPYIPTSGKRKKIIIEKISQYLDTQHKKIVYDAGSGTGDILIPLAKKFPNHKFVGIEWGMLPNLVAKLKAKKLSNINFIQGDIFKHNFNDADIVYCYIVAQMENLLSEKFSNEIKQDCLVVTNGHLFSGMQIVEELKSDEKWLTNSVYILKIK